MKPQAITIEALRPGDIMLSPPNSWIGKSIVAFTKGEVSHAALFCGEVDSKPKIAHSFIPGLMLSTLQDFMVKDNVELYHVLRHTAPIDFGKVVSVAQEYVKNGSDYPFGNLLVLGLLIAYKKLSPQMVHSRAYCDFLAMVIMKIMRNVRDFVGRGKNGMTCSQFVAQCFTDAQISNGQEYGIRFRQLINAYPDRSWHNYFVTSDDLLHNSENLEYQGILYNDFAISG